MTDIRFNRAFNRSATRKMFPLCALALTLSLAACSQQSALPVPKEETASAEEQDSPWTATVGEADVQALAVSGSPSATVLTNKMWTSATSGYGPIEIDRSNGKKLAGDGKTLTVGGKTYAKGFGVHATSRLTFPLGGKCATFTANVGVDDEVGSRGSVVFQVFADGVKLFDSGLMRGSNAAKTLKVNVAGKKELKLVVTDGGDGGGSDHADWLAPTLSCAAQTEGVTAPTPAPTPAPAPAPAPTPTPAPAPAPAPAPVQPRGIHYSPPIVITRGGTYSGAWESNDPSQSAVTIKTSEPVIIENAYLRGPGSLIRGLNVTLTVRNTRGEGVNPNVLGKSQGRFIDVSARSLRAENNTIEGTRGIYVNGYMGDRTTAQTIKILRNVAHNIDGRKSDGQGGYLTTKGDWAQFLQLGRIANVPGVEIGWNHVENEPRQSGVEDNINLYASSGTSDSPIQIHDNFIKGAYAPDPAASYTGGGIMIGDGCTEGNAVNNVVARGNTVLETSNYGMAVAAGTNVLIENNTVLGTGKLADGTFLDADSDAGIYLRDYCNRGGDTSSVIARSNTVGWGAPDANYATRRQDISARVGVASANNQIAKGAIDPALLESAATDWKSRTLTAGIALGSAE